MVSRSLRVERSLKHAGEHSSPLQFNTVLPLFYAGPYGGGELVGLSAGGVSNTSSTASGPPFLAVARAHSGSNSPQDCYSIPSCRYATRRRRLWVGGGEEMKTPCGGCRRAQCRTDCFVRTVIFARSLLPFYQISHISVSPAEAVRISWF